MPTMRDAEKSYRRNRWTRNTIKKLNPIVDKGKLIQWEASSDSEKRPLTATVLLRYFNEQVAHQGRRISEGAVRSAGFRTILYCSH